MKVARERSGIGGTRRDFKKRIRVERFAEWEFLTRADGGVGDVRGQQQEIAR